MDQLPAGLDGLNAELSGVASGLTAVLEELREISHGIHPVILSSAGLGAALKALVRLPLTSALLSRWHRAIANGHADDDVAAAVTASE